MQFGLFGLHRGSSANRETLARRARLAEAVGFDSIWVGDHIALPTSEADDGGNAAGEPRLEVLVCLAYLAAVTTRIRLAAGVIILPQRQPVLLAKQLTTIDVLSNGRLIVGIGVGYLEAELNALGVTLAERGARADEYLAALHALWSQDASRFDGRFVSFGGVIERPRPAQLPHPPIVVGGNSPAAVRRAVESANGWYGWELGVDEAAAALTELRDAAGRHERPPELGDLEITITPPGPVDQALARRYADLGIHRLALAPPATTGTSIDELIATAGSTLIGRV